MKKRSPIERLLLSFAWIGLIGGLLFTVFLTNSIIESKQEMCVPQAALTFVGGVAASVLGWALLIHLVHISDKLRKIDNQLKEK